MKNKSISNRGLTTAGNSLLSKSLRRLRHRRAIRHFEAVRALRTASAVELIPRLKSATALLRCAVPPPNLWANLAPHELMLVCSICAVLKPSVLFEFGTFDGVTTLHLAINSAVDAKVHTLDLHPNDPIRAIDSDDTYYTRGIEVGQYFRNEPEAGQILQHFGNSLDFDHAPFRKGVDLVFVDGGHDYEIVRSDSVKALEMLRPGGIVLWHDYGYAHEGVYTALHELAHGSEILHIAGTGMAIHLNGHQDR